MVLVFDIGNTRIKCGLFDNDKLKSFSTFTDIESIASYINQNKFSNVCISSVSTSKTKQIDELLKDTTSVKPFIITSDSKMNIKLDYQTPQTLGVDRICSIEGTLFLMGINKVTRQNDFIITMDCGTATTLNILESPCTFLGGTISPGIKLMFNSLHTNTAQLPSLNVSDYENIIGKSTSASIASGVLNSTIGLLDRVMVELKTIYKATHIDLYITGGNAESILPYIRYNHKYEPGLVLYGAYSLFKLNMDY